MQTSPWASLRGQVKMITKDHKTYCINKHAGQLAMQNRSEGANGEKKQIISVFYFYAGLTILH